MTSGLSPHDPFKEPFPIIEYVPPPEPRLERVVRWFKHDRHVPAVVKSIIVWSCAILANVVTLGLLLPLTLRMKNLSALLDMKDEALRFDNEMRDKIKLKTVSPPLKESIILKSSTRSFNHVNEYAIESDVLWYRRISKPPQELCDWRPLFFDGVLTGRKPVKLSVDGANMVVIDDQGAVHYRKLLLEARKQDLFNKPTFHHHLFKSAPGVLSKTDWAYAVIDKTQEVNWDPCWFSLPIVNRIVNVITGQRLFASGIISHRGRFNEGYTDAHGNFCESTTGVTTLYELQDGNHRIRKYDPWVPTWSAIEQALPETPSSSFLSENLDVSASVLFSIGYNVDIPTKKGTLAIVTNFLDIDTSGGNPGLTYAYESEQRKKEGVRYLPDVVNNNGWIEHALPYEAVEIYNQLAIIQTGSGNDARELRIAGKHRELGVGYFYKTLSEDSSWRFEENRTSIDMAHPLERTKDFDERDVEHWAGEYASPQGQPYSVLLSNFGPGINHSSLTITFEGKIYNLPLHKRLGVRTFLGRRDERYELIVPRATVPDGNPLLLAFGNRRVIPVRIQEKDIHQIPALALRCSGKQPPLPILVKKTPQ
jgi:hypothetical protein